MIIAIDLADCSTRGDYLTIRRERMDQSLQGHDGKVKPSDFPRYFPRLVHEPVGVHRYKPEL